MSQSCFSLGFLSQNSLWKLSTFCEYKSIYSRVYKECEESITTKQGILTTWPREFKSRANCLARLEVLSCSAIVGMTLQLPLHASHMCHSGDLPIARSSCENPPMHTHLNFFTLSHTQPLYNSHLNTGYLIAKLQANLVQNKANTWLNKFNFTVSPFDYSMTKP